MLHGDGEPLLADYQNGGTHFCYAMMKADIAESKAFRNLLPGGTVYDLETPYGYGGPLSDGLIPEEDQQRFQTEMAEFCRVENIISQFVRFHPLLGNESLMPLAFETRYMRDTIFIDTSCEALINQNMDSKSRNMVRKAAKNGVTIEQKDISEYEDFLSMYEETMLRDQAEDYYFFKREYFESQRELNHNATIFYAIREEIPIAGAIIYYNNRFAHYHLAGTQTEYRQYAPSNLLLYEVACWAARNGIRQFHLGGGMAPEDSLFGFKKQFNKNGRLPFVIGRTVFNRERYQSLLKLRKQADPDFNENNNRMIQYRC